MPMLNRVLLTNDDGIDAPGMAVLEAIAQELAEEVWVVAPELDQSGQSHAVSLHHALRISDQGPRRFAVSGTPGDCAAVGICHLLREAPADLVLSGVNRGLNLGMETVFSGTVGGAMTAMMLGVPAIALSQAYTDRDNVPWESARTLGVDVVQRLWAMGWGDNACLNVNFPALAPAAAREMVLARQGVGMIAGMDLDTRIDPRGHAYHWLTFRRGEREQGPESDYSALQAGHVVVTPLRYDRTDNDAYADLATRLPRFSG